MTHYDITIGNDVARDVHCEFIMGHGIVMGTYHDVTMHTDVAFGLLKYPYTKTIHLDLQTRIHLSLVLVIVHRLVFNFALYYVISNALPIFNNYLDFKPIPLYYNNAVLS